MNANFRLGTPDHAAALGYFAARTAADSQAAALAHGVAAEALEALAVWAQPPGRDRVTGLWRPLPPRDPQPALTALEQAWPAVTAPAAAPAILVAALKAAEALGLPVLDATLARLSGHPDKSVADEVKRLLSRKAEEPAALAARLESGPLREQQAALAALGASTNAAADAVVLAWLDRLLTNAVLPGLRLDVLEAAQRRAAGSVGPAARRSSDSIGDDQKTGGPPVPPFSAALARYTNSLPAGDSLASWRPSLTGGDPVIGRKLFAERADWGCQRCHKLHGEGGDVGPDLTGLAKTRGAEYVLEAILHPNKDIAPGYENIVVTRKSGGAHAGVLKAETDTELVLDVPEDGRMTIPKADIADRQRGLSSMVEGLGELITPREMRDLISALAE